MPYQDISESIVPASWNRIQNALSTLKQELHFLINLTPQERMELSKMGDGSLAFVKKVGDYIKSNPEYLPGYLDKAEFNKDLDLAFQLDSVLQMLMQLTQGVEHTRMAVGSEAYKFALIYYNSVGVAATQNQAGAGAIHEDLGQRFQYRPSGNGEAETPAV